MPALYNFITQNGTMLSNNYTPMIAHTADDSLTNYTGLYGDRHGQGITNTYETYVGGTPASKSSFAYWTGTYNLDAFPNMPYSANVPAAGSPPKTPPAPWVPFTRAGCDVGDVSTANMVLENTNPDLQNVFGPSSPEVAQYNADTDSFKDQETNDYVGVGVHCARATRSARRPWRPSSARRARRTRGARPAPGRAGRLQRLRRRLRAQVPDAAARTGGQCRHEPQLRQRGLVPGRGRHGQPDRPERQREEGAFLRPDHAGLPRVRADQRLADARLRRRHAGDGRAHHLRLHL